MKALIFDTETTGLIDNHTIKLKSQPEVIEFYCGLWNLKTGKLLDDIEFLIKPSKPISEEITAITRITNEMVKGCPTFNLVANLIKAFIQKGEAIISHNASFDKEIIDLEYERLNDAIEWPPLLCTVEQTIHLKGYRLSMTNLYDHLFGEKFEDAHRAKPDTQALARCCIELYKRGCL